MSDRTVAQAGDHETGLLAPEKFRDESDGTYSRIQRSRLEGWDATGAAWIKVAVSSTGAIQTSGSTAAGGGGAVTVADGADVAEGATTDAAVITDVAGTVSGKLRGLVKWAFERMPASLGQKAMTASLPVVLASDQAAIPVTASAGTNLNTSLLALETTQSAGNTLTGAVTETAPATDIASSGLNGRLQRVAQRLTSLIALLPASLGQKAMTASLAVTVASDQTVIPVSDNAASLTVDAPVGTPVFARLSDGAAALIGQKAMAASLPVVIASDQAAVPASQSGTWTVQPGNTANTTAWKVDGSAVTQPVVEVPASTIATAVSSASGAAITLSLASVAAQSHYINFIQIVLYNAAARTGGATPVTVTTSNLTGSPAFTFSSVGAIGATEIQFLEAPDGLKSAAAATPTTIVCPATTGVIWRINVIYRAAA